MLQANLAIVLTFITTLIDELGETEKLTTPKLVVIIVAFITVIFLFNYTLKTENKEFSGLTEITKDLKNSMNLINSVPGQLQNTFNKGSSVITQGASQLQNSVNQGASQLQNSVNQGASQVQNSMVKSASQLQNSVNQGASQLQNSVTMPPPANIPIDNTNNTTISTSTPPAKESFRNIKINYNNSTQRMPFLFRN